jgi:hypothetical protein
MLKEAHVCMICNFPGTGTAFVVQKTENVQREEMVAQNGHQFVTGLRLIKSFGYFCLKMSSAS